MVFFIVTDNGISTKIPSLTNPICWMEVQSDWLTRSHAIGPHKRCTTEARNSETMPNTKIYRGISSENEAFRKINIFSVGIKIPSLSYKR